MSAVVVPLPTDAAIEAAWERYVAITAQAVEDPRLMLDRAFCERQVAAWAEFRDVFLARRQR